MFLVVSFWALTPSAWGSGLPEITINSHGYQVPTGDARLVYRFGDTGPREALDFFEKNGKGWLIYWDFASGTPRYLRPLEPVLVAAPEMLAPELDRDALLAAVKAFLDGNADFFGVPSAELGDPYIYPLGKSWVMVFGQTTPGGLPIRGANLRLVINSTGELAWLKAFLARKCPDPEEALFSQSSVETSAGLQGGTVHSSRLEMGFGEAGSAIPIWSLEVTGGDGAFSEHIVSAQSGEVIARRQVVKYFDMAGTAKGRSPDRNDIFTGPKVMDRDLIVESPFDGVLIRGADWEPLGLTGLNGDFFIPGVHAKGQDGLKVFLGTRLSLEHGYFDEKASPPGYVSQIEVRPLGASLLPAPLPLEDDENQDGIPDATFPAADAGSPTMTSIVLNVGTKDAEYTKRAWWLQSYHHTKRMYSWTEYALNRATLLKGPFFPIEPLEVAPSTVKVIQQYRGPIPQAGKPPRPAQVISGSTFRFAAGGQSPEEDVVPTVLLHEVGHHIIFNMTASVNCAPLEFEEGLADALAVFAQENPLCQVFFKKSDTPTAYGFCLDLDKDDFRSERRADVGDGFFNLHVALGPKENHTAHALLLHLLASNRARDRFDKCFDNSSDLIEQLLACDALISCEDANCRPTPHQTAILNAFRGKQFFEAPFIRGDANLDKKVDISDAISILGFLFGGGNAYKDCRNAMDVDNSSEVNISDAIRLLTHLFLNGRDPAAPYPDCGLDPEPPSSDENLGCFEYICPR
jgi:hypothetical protein